MTADLTREQAREQIARAIYVGARGGTDMAKRVWEVMTDRPANWSTRNESIDHADAALTVLWPVVEELRAPEPVAEVEAGGVIEGVTFYGNVRIGAGARLTNVTIKPRRTR